MISQALICNPIFCTCRVLLIKEYLYFSSSSSCICHWAVFVFVIEQYLYLSLSSTCICHWAALVFVIEQYLYLPLSSTCVCNWVVCRVEAILRDPFSRAPGRAWICIWLLVAQLCAIFLKINIWEGICVCMVFGRPLLGSSKIETLCPLFAKFWFILSLAQALGKAWISNSNRIVTNITLGG